MKRPASDMTRESNCAYTRGRSRHPSSPALLRPSVRPSARPVLAAFETIHPRPYGVLPSLAVSPRSTLLPRGSRIGNGSPDNTLVYSNFIPGPFGISRIGNGRLGDQRGDATVFDPRAGLSLADA